MCGICGYIAPNRLPLDEMMNSLDHRGPDNRGKVEVDLGQDIVGLGHTRLKIIDLSDRGNQPMQTEYERYTLIYNGEVYNFRELKEELLPGHKFRSGTDTEVLLHLLEVHGLEKILPRLNGAFAFAWFDKEEQRLWLVRDRFGIKPLYYYKDFEKFIFGSEVKAILKAGVQPKLDKGVFNDYLIFKYAPEDYTMFEEVFRVPPASYLELNIKAHKVKVKEWYSPLKESERYKGISYEEAQAEIRRIMESAVGMRTMADVPVGTFFSGGVDSSIIAWHLKDNQEIQHYCASKSREDILVEGTTSDADYAQSLATKWGLNLEFVNIGKEELTNRQLDDIVWFGDDLIADGSQIPSFLINQKASVKTKVILSGMGADELFFGYAGHQLTRLSFYMNWLPGGLRKMVQKEWSKLNPGQGRLKAYKRYLKKMGVYGDDPLKYGKYGIVGNVEAAQRLAAQQGGQFERILTRYFATGKDVWTSIREFERNNFLQKNLMYMDRMSMANHIENRVPFLDHRMVELAYAMDASFQIDKKLHTKKILKAAYENVLPKNVVNRRKAGFGMPLRSIFSHEQNFWNLVDRERLLDSNLIDHKELNNILHEHQTGADDHSALLFAIVSFQHWMDSMGVK